LDKSQGIAKTLGVTYEAFTAALDKATAEVETKAKVPPMTAAEKEKAFWKVVAVAGLMCLGFIVLLLFFILGWDIGWVREVNGSPTRVLVFWVAFLCFSIAVLVSGQALVEAETRLVEDPPSVGT
jgi:cation transporter-like permease